MKNKSYGKLKLENMPFSSNCFHWNCKTVWQQIIEFACFHHSAFHTKAFCKFQDWGCIELREINFLFEKFLMTSLTYLCSIFWQHFYFINWKTTGWTF